MDAVFAMFCAPTKHGITIAISIVEQMDTVIIVAAHSLMHGWFAAGLNLGAGLTGSIFAISFFLNASSSRFTISFLLHSVFSVSRIEGMSFTSRVNDGSRQYIHDGNEALSPELGRN
jgi:hypothetical protein